VGQYVNAVKILFEFPVLLGWYAMSLGNLFPVFQDDVLVSSSRVKMSKNTSFSSVLGCDATSHPRRMEYSATLLQKAKNLHKIFF
jgi:hypothetical protein